MKQLMIMLALVCSLMQAASAHAEVGTVSLVKVWGYKQQPSATKWEALYRRDPVEMNQRLRTPDGGALHVRFIDDTELRLGSAAEVTVDRFVFDPVSGAGNLQAEVSRGLMRFITGRMKKDGVRIGTPTAIIGIRGTDFTIEVAEDGTTTVAVHEGEVVIMPRIGGGSESVPAGQNARVASNTSVVEMGVKPPAPDIGLEKGAGLDGPAGGGGGGGDGNDSGGDGSGGGC
ncbi:FecR family protein [Nisaea sediminum]|uniref:FecR family protein n=1 Tax=Nisaea sediminum TaxID=2775867 RepID=UPI0018671E62|nr:FecR family protein [Nisaea sediminum]